MAGPPWHGSNVSFLLVQGQGRQAPPTPSPKKPETIPGPLHPASLLPLMRHTHMSPSGAAPCSPLACIPGIPSPQQGWRHRAAAHAHAVRLHKGRGHAGVSACRVVAAAAAAVAAVAATWGNQELHSSLHTFV